MREYKLSVGNRELITYRHISARIAGGELACCTPAHDFYCYMVARPASCRALARNRRLSWHHLETRLTTQHRHIERRRALSSYAARLRLLCHHEVSAGALSQNQQQYCPAQCRAGENSKNSCCRLFWALVHRRRRRHSSGRRGGGAIAVVLA